MHPAGEAALVNGVLSSEMTKSLLRRLVLEDFLYSRRELPAHGARSQGRGFVENEEEVHEGPQDQVKYYFHDFARDFSSCSS